MNDNLLFYVGSRQEQIFIAKLKLLLKGRAINHVQRCELEDFAQRSGSWNITG